MRISDRLQQLSLPAAPADLRRRITEALDAEDQRARIAASTQPVADPITRRRPRFRLPRWSWAAAVVATLVTAVVLPGRRPTDVPLRIAPGLMGLSQLAQLPSSDAGEVRRWLESYVDYPVDVPTIRNASLSGGQILRSGHTNAVAVTYQMQGRPLMYLVMPTAHVMGRQLDARKIDTVSLQGLSAVTWVQTGTARMLLAPMPTEEVAEMAEQCRKGTRPQ